MNKVALPPDWTGRLLRGAFLGLLILVLYRGVLDQWWMFDDPQILKHALSEKPFHYFFIPEAYRPYNLFSFTPWLTLVDDMDLWLFGFKPKGFYLHSLMTLVVCALLLDRVLRFFIHPAAALSGSILFVIGTPTAVAVQQLMVRHYLEGLLLYLLGIYCFIESLKKGRWIGSVGAGLLLTLSMTAKELFVPLSLVPLLLPLADRKMRWLRAIPVFVGLIAYIPWRWAMLGSLIGGYTPSGVRTTPTDLSAWMARFLEVPSLLSLDPLGLCAGLIISVIIIFYRSTHRLQDYGSLGLLLGLVVVPLIPLALQSPFGPDADRFFMVVWVLMAITLALGVDRMPGGALMKPSLGALLVLGVGLPVLFKTEEVTAHRQALYDLYQNEGKAYLDLHKDDQLWVSPKLLVHYFMGLQHLRGPMGGRNPGGQYLMDESALLSSRTADGHLFRYDENQKRMVDVRDNVPSMIEGWRQTLRSLPIQIQIDYEPGAQSLKWSMGPYREGAYHLLAEGGLIPIPAVGAIRRESNLPSCFRIRYQDPKGWRVYSPPLSLTSKGSQHDQLTWEGSGDLFNSDTSLGTCHEID